MTDPLITVSLPRDTAATVLRGCRAGIIRRDCVLLNDEEDAIGDLCRLLNDALGAYTIPAMEIDDTDPQPTADIPLTPITLQPGDTLLIATHHQLTTEQAGNIRRQVLTQIPNLGDVCVLGGIDHIAVQREPELCGSVSPTIITEHRSWSAGHLCSLSKGHTGWHCDDTPTNGPRWADLTTVETL